MFKCIYVYFKSLLLYISVYVYTWISVFKPVTVFSNLARSCRHAQTHTYTHTVSLGAEHSECHANCTIGARCKLDTPADLTVQSKQPASFELLKKHLFEWTRVAFLCSCWPHSHKNGLCLQKVLNDKLRECEAPTCVRSVLLVTRSNKAFLL